MKRKTGLVAVALLIVPACGSSQEVGAASGGQRDTGVGGESGSGRGGSSAGAGASGDVVGGHAGEGASGAAPSDASTNQDASSGTAVDARADAASATACDPGTSSTTWAANCATAAATSCVEGTWTDPGSTTNDPLQCASAHFAVHAPAGTITAAQCSAATDALETLVWPSYFGSPMFFPVPYCATAKKFKTSIVVHTDYGLTGGGWGSGYMGMWVGPGATSDHWGLAHEFMHAVQSTTKGLACAGGTNKDYCGWIYESHANYSPHQLAEYRSDMHCSEMLMNAPHLYLGSTRDRYCNWQFMEFLKDKHCHQAVNDIWTTGKPGNDPFDNIAATRGWSMAQMNDFMGEWAMHNITWDYKDPAPTSAGAPDPGAAFRKAYGQLTDVSRPERRHRLTMLEPIDALDKAHRRFFSPYLWAPQRWGYNVVRLTADAGATHVKVTFRGVVQQGASSDWRWGLVATDAAVSKPRYSTIQRGSDAALDFCVNAGESLWLVVMATPSAAQHIYWDQPYASIYRYPYRVELEGAWPQGFEGGAAAPCATGLSRVANGGGCAPTNLASTVYVGPYAQVLGGTVSGNARIEDHAVIVSGSVTGGTVGGLTILSNASVSGSAKVQTSFYPIGFFETQQSLSGTAWLYGDVELRGQGFNVKSGAYSGMVDDMAASATVQDVTIAPPYPWAP